MATTDGIVRNALSDLDAGLSHWTQTLVDLCRIPSISASGFPPEEVRHSAQAVAQTLRDAGVEHVEVLEIPGVHPYVYGDWLHRPGAPTVLLYGHHDVMPPGRAEKWLSPAFEPIERGGRLFLGGHSYGGRQASMLLAAEPALASGLLLQSYPLHPPGRPRDLRIAHLPALRVPTLFVIGTTDPFGSLAELDKARELIPGRTSLLKVNGGHDLGWSRKRGDATLPGRIADAFLELAGPG